MRVTGVGYGNSYYIPQMQVKPQATAQAAGTVMSKDEMKKMLNLMFYNQAGMAFKLAKMAAKLYAGLNLDVQA
ncbi:MAG: hypothetical protein J7L34_03600 [Thermotogaceae bacterium]|nr:hypothetical protein [Thermotogaceae bacterium]